MKHHKHKSKSTMLGDVTGIAGTGLTMGAFGIAAGKTGMTGLGSALHTGSGFLSPMMTLSMTGHTIKGVKKIQKEMRRLY